MWEKIGKFLKEVKVEMEKVSWPSIKETLNWTVIVILTAGFVALLIAIFDYLFLKIMEYFF